MISFELTVFEIIKRHVSQSDNEYDTRRLSHLCNMNVVNIFLLSKFKSLITTFDIYDAFVCCPQRGPPNI